MLKKLYKHEFYSLFRNLLPLYAAVLGLGIVGKLTHLVETENRIINTVRGTSYTFYAIAIIATFILGLVVIVNRFYKNLLSHEGYLTFTLPFTPSQHINCKLICGAIVSIVNFLVVLGSLLILAIGTGFYEGFVREFKEIFGAITNYVETAQIIAIVFEIILMLIICEISSLLMFYAAMAIGQQFKSKVGGAVAGYFMLYAGVQIITSCVMLPITIANGDKIEAFFDRGISSVIIMLALLVVWYLILSVVYYCITRYFLTKKLNLE